MNWITKFIKPKIAALFKKKTADSEQVLWTTCECKNLIYKEDLQKDLNCCPKCEAHHKLTCTERFEIFFDNKEFNLIPTPSPKDDPINFIDRYCSPLKISQDTKYLAEYIAVKAIIESLVDDNTAPSIAAGAIFLACMIDKSTNVTKKQVAESCKTSEVTISKCYKKLNDNRDKLLPSIYKNK